MTTPQQKLSRLQVILDEPCSERWRDRFGITEIYVNDIAAGALIEVPSSWDDKESKITDTVAEGLRRLLQELWRQDLARPVVAVFWPKEGAAEGKALKALRKLTWDQAAHRGDFALREASSREKAEDLLRTLLGDTMDALDDSARKDKVGIAEVEAELQKQGNAPSKAGEAPRTSAEDHLIRRLRDELKRARNTRTDPDLMGVLTEWLRAEEVAP